MQHFYQDYTVNQRLVQCLHSLVEQRVQSAVRLGSGCVTRMDVNESSCLGSILGIPRRSNKLTMKALGSKYYTHNGFQDLQPSHFGYLGPQGSQPRNHHEPKRNRVGKSRSSLAALEIFSLRAQYDFHSDRLTRKVMTGLIEFERVG